MRLQDRLDDVFGPAAKRKLHRIVLCLDVQALVFKCLKNTVAGIKAFLAIELTTILDLAIVREDGDEFEVVSLANVEIVGIVRRCDFYGTSTK